MLSFSLFHSYTIFANTLIEIVRQLLLKCKTQLKMPNFSQNIKFHAKFQILNKMSNFQLSELLTFGISNSNKIYRISNYIQTDIFTQNVEYCTKCRIALKLKSFIKKSEEEVRTGVLRKISDF